MKRVEFTFYDWPEFEKFLNQLPNKDAAKLLTIISKIEQYGLQIAQRQKWVKKLQDNLYEIRSKRSSNIQRAIYFHWEQNSFVITHGFTKKSQKTPRHEIKKAIERRTKLIRRRGR